MDLKEVKNRIAILEKTKPIKITKSMLRSGGMDSRINRKQICGYNKNIETEKKHYKNLLMSMSEEEIIEEKETIGVLKLNVKSGGVW
jgi:biotin synthase-like enzyme